MSAVCQLPSLGQAERASYTSVVRSRSKKYYSFAKKWCGPSSLNHRLSAESDLQYSLNLAETCRFKATAFFLTYGVIKNRIHYFPLCSRIRLDTISTDFVLGKLLNTTNAVRFSMTMFSWQPLLRILICRFIYSARLRSKLNGKSTAI